MLILLFSPRKIFMHPSSVSFMQMKDEYIILLTPFQHKSYFSTYINLHHIFSPHISWRIFIYLAGFYLLVFKLFNLSSPTLLKIIYPAHQHPWLYLPWACTLHFFHLKQVSLPLKANKARLGIASYYLQKVLQEIKLHEHLKANLKHTWS